MLASSALDANSRYAYLLLCYHFADTCVVAGRDQHYRQAAGVPLHGVAHMPYCGCFGSDADIIGYLWEFVEDGSSGLDKPAAAIVETVQGEGGVNVAGWH